MNKNTILGFISIFIILVGYSWYIAPSAEDIQRQEAEQRKNDSIKAIQYAQAQIADSIKNAQAKESMVANNEVADQIPNNINDSALNSLQMQKYGDFAAMAHGEDKDYIIETDLLKLKVSTKTGNITYAELKDYHTYDTLPLVLFNKNSASMSYLLNDKRVETKDLYFEPVVKGGKSLQDSIYVKNDDVYTFSMRIYPNDANGNVDKNKFFEFEYIIKGDDYMVDYRINMKGMSEHVAPGLNDIPLYWSMNLNGKEKDPAQEVKHTAIYYRYTDEDVDNLSEMNEEEDDELETKTQWISYKQQFFSVVLIADNSFAKAKIKQYKDASNTNPKYLKSMYSDISIPLSYSSDFQTIPMKMYMGPNKYSILKTYDMELERQIPLGWGFFLLHWINRFIVIPVFDFLSGFGWNYGIIILVLTILLKLFLFPITYKTYMSSAKMRVLKPEIDEIGAKFPKKEDAMKKQQATMDLYKKVGVNPMAGCIPMLLQMPILFAMFRFFPASFELRQEHFLWATDLSSYDSIYSWSAQIPLLSRFYGNHISLFTLLMTVSTILYTRMNNQMMSSSQQMPGMKTMMYIMPIMFLGFFNNYAAGLSFYYFLANVITFGQMYLIRRYVDEDAIRAKLQANKKKPVKKSKFQARLEEMAKQKGYNPKKK
jgi:YidC/Oxa1 family membrane protein insertase